MEIVRSERIEAGVVLRDVLEGDDHPLGRVIDGHHRLTGPARPIGLEIRSEPGHDGAGEEYLLRRVGRGRTGAEGDVSVR